jgi:Domain of unknown function (DUF4157)/Bacterial toxin 4
MPPAFRCRGAFRASKQIQTRLMSIIPVNKNQSESKNTTGSKKQPFFNSKGNSGFFAPAIQTKLTVNDPGDAYEQEADAVADKVVQLSRSDKSSISATPPLIQQKCNNCGKEELQKKEETGKEEEKIQRKETSSGDGLLNGNGIKLQRSHLAQLGSSTLQKKCADCDKEELQRKEGDEKEEMLQTKSLGDGAADAGDAVESSLNSSKGSGSSLPAPVREQMESSIGADFSGVKIHTGGPAVQMSQDLNAQAFTHGSDIYFNEGKYNPSTTDGQHLLAHELTHVVQQNSGLQTKRIQRAPGDDDFVLIETTGDTEENIGISLESAPQVQKFLVLIGNKLYAYNIESTKPVHTFDLKLSPVLPPFFYISSGAGGFYVLGRYNDGSTGIAGKPNPIPQDIKEFFADFDSRLNLPNWFEGGKVPQNMHDWVGSSRVCLIATNYAPGAGGGKTSGGEGKKSTPPKPTWMKPFEEEMKVLIAATRIAEMSSEDIPHDFRFYHSEKFERWRAKADQKDPQGKSINEVYLDLKEGADKKVVLADIRQQIRINLLKNYDSTRSDVKDKTNVLDPKFKWARELKLLLDKLVSETRSKHPDEIDLPDRLSLVGKADDADHIYLQIAVFVHSTNELEQAETSLKSGILPFPLEEAMLKKTDELFLTIKKACRGLHGRAIRSEEGKKEEAKAILKAYDAFINPQDVREDGRSVTGAEHEFEMKMIFESIHGKADTVSNVVANMQTIVYMWDVYRVNDQLSDDQKKVLSPDWTERQKQLRKYFTDSKKLITAPVVNQSRLKTINELLKSTGSANPVSAGAINRKEIEDNKLLGIYYGASASLTPEATINFPQEPGDYIVFCRAQPDMSNGYYRLPSESFFPIHLQDGFELAKESTYKTDTELKKLEEQKKELTTEEDKKEVQDRIDQLKKREGLNIMKRAENDVAETDDVIRIAGKIRSLYVQYEADLKAKKALSPFVFLLEDDKTDGKKMVDIWAMLEMHENYLPFLERVDNFIVRLKEQRKGLTDLQGRINSFKEDVDMSKPVHTPIATLISEETGQEYQLIMMIGETPGNTEEGVTKITLVDVTTYKQQKKYHGSSKLTDKNEALKAAIREAFDNFGEEVKYGRGYVHYRVPSLGLESKVRSKPGTKQQILSILSTVAAIAGIAALIIGTIATGGALGIAAAALGIGSMAIGAGLAIHNLSERYENHRLDLDVETALDILNIVGPLAMTVGAIAKGAKLAGAAAGAIETAAGVTKLNRLLQLERGIAYYQKVELITNIFLINGQVMHDLSQIDASGLPPGKKRALRKQIMVNALVSNAMMGLALRNELFLKAPPSEEALNRMINDASKELRYKGMMQGSKLKDAQGNWTLPELNAAKPADAPVTETPGGGKTTDAPTPKGEPVKPTVKPEAETVPKGSKDTDSIADIPQPGPKPEEAAPKDSKASPPKEATKPADGAQEKLPSHDTAAPEPAVATNSKKYIDDRKLPEGEIKGHAQSPDKKHHVEVYDDHSIGRCSSTPGERCTLMLTAYKDVLDKRPAVKQELDNLQTAITKLGTKPVPAATMNELAALEQRLRNIQMIQKLSTAPAGWRVQEVRYDVDPVAVLVPHYNDRIILEFPNGERVWRTASGNIVHEAPIGSSIGRQGLERTNDTGRESGISGLTKYERAHSFGQGFGFESPYGLWYAPQFVNQRMQNEGIESYIRRLRDLLPAGQQLVVTTETAAFPGTRRLKSIKYKASVVGGGTRTEVFSFEIHVGGTRDVPVTTNVPLAYSNHTDPAKKAVVDGLKALIPPADIPKYVINPVNHTGAAK